MGEPPAPGRNGERDFKGEKRSNATHRSTTDNDAPLFRKGDGQASRLCFIGHVLMENRNGPAVDAELTRAAGTAERLAALAMAETLPAGQRTIGADKGYDTHDFVMELRELGINPHVAQNAYETGTARRCSAVDGRTTRHGYALSQKKRKRIEDFCPGRAHERLAEADPLPTTSPAIPPARPRHPPDRSPCWQSPELHKPMSAAC